MDVLDQILTLAGRLTVTGLLVLTVVALLMEKVVPGAALQRELAERDRQLADLARERDEWKQLAMSSTRLAGDAARAVDPTVPPPPVPPVPARPAPAVGGPAPVATLPDPAAADAAPGGGGKPS